MAKILVIDDERAIRNILKETLEFEGYKVDVAENGAQGVEMAQADNYDLIYSDVKMPQMDGTELLAALKQPDSNCADVPVVMISGHGNIETARTDSDHAYTAACGGMGVRADEGLAGDTEPLEVYLVADTVAGT